MPLLVATDSQLLVVEEARGTMRRAEGLDDARPTCLAADPRLPGRAWCGTDRNGILRSDDGGASWRPMGLGGRRIMSLMASPSRRS